MPSGPNVLIMSAAAKVALVQRFKAAVLDYSGRVFTADMAQNCAAGFFAHKHFVLKPLHDKGALLEIAALCRGYGITLIVPTRDGELPFFADHKDFFLAKGITVLVPSRENLNQVSDKGLFSNIVEKAGLKAVPRINRSVQAADYPVFIRPKSGAGGIGARRVDRAENLPEDLSNYLVHPYLEAPEYSVDLLMNLDGSQALGAVCRERIYVVAGESKITRVVDLPGAVSQTCVLGELFNLVGHNTFQVFNHAERGILFIEVNPRFGGASNLSIEAGLNSPQQIIDMTQGKAPRSVQVKTGLTLYRYGQDVFNKEDGTP